MVLNHVPKLFDTFPIERWDLHSCPLNLSSVIVSQMEYGKSGAMSLSQLGPKKLTVSPSCLLRCLLLEPTHHDLRKPKQLTERPS